VCCGDFGVRGQVLTPALQRITIFTYPKPRADPRYHFEVTALVLVTNSNPNCNWLKNSSKFNNLIN
jgi:hypothetical protein